MGTRALLAMLAGGLIVAACADQSRLATTSGDTVPLARGELIYDTQCASCHGPRGEGGAGPALAGHSSDQVVRQLRAPVGAMPMFSPHRLSENGVDDIAAFVDGLSSGEAHGGHEHAMGQLATQEAAQIEHVLLRDALVGRDGDRALKILEGRSDQIVGNHAEAMMQIEQLAEAADFGAAVELASDMITDDPITQGVHGDDLLLLLVADAASVGNIDAAAHWAGLFEGEATRPLRDAAGDHESLAAALAELDFDVTTPHDDADGHHDEAEEPAADHTDDEAHDEAEESGVEHDDADGHHDEAEPPVADHDDAGSEPHDH